MDTTGNESDEREMAEASRRLGLIAELEGCRGWKEYFLPRLAGMEEGLRLAVLEGKLSVEEREEKRQQRLAVVEVAGLVGRDKAGLEACLARR
ncbi:hypothetical protein Ga0100231_004995 [Opitutaceae bacterium TAV4]|nr:hypothetical protein Ga0100231_004995 [Opitutaceae bacterium TAV4]RRK02352.1 hypothetical protein Ga0100230_004140 [Opitutaceae bacterium TAV3]